MRNDIIRVEMADTGRPARSSHGRFNPPPAHLSGPHAGCIPARAAMGCQVGQPSANVNSGEPRGAEMRADISPVVSELKENLPTTLIAELCGVPDPKVVRRWAEGRLQPREDAVRRLRSALEVVHILAEQHSVEVVRAWFVVMNPCLEDWAPVTVLRDVPPDDAAERVIAAARAFAAPHRSRHLLK